MPLSLLSSVRSDRHLPPPTPLMELTSFPFLNQEIRDDLSHFSNFLSPHGRLPPAAGDGSSFGAGGSVNQRFKRRRKEDGGEEGERASGRGDDSGGGGRSIGDMLTSLVLLEEEEKRERESFFLEMLRGRASLESNSDIELRAAGDYYCHIQAHYDGANELEMRKNKSARQSEGAAAEGSFP